MKPTAIGQCFLVLIVSCAHVIICSSTGNYTDRLSLLEFKKALSLDPHQALMSWNGSTPLCSWEGVLCSVKHPSRVTSLNLTNRGLVGKISPSLGNITFLKVVVLSANSFSGEIPMSLGHLNRLQILSLENNTLQGRIPALSNSSILKELWLANNQLTGQIHEDLPRSLEVLDLTTNNLTGTIPGSVANITRLQVFSCAMNEIEGNIPNEFANLLGLYILRVSINKMSGQFPQAVLNLSNLAELSLSINNFSGVVPSGIGNSLPHLQAILLDGNFFHGHIPSSLTNASKLSTIAMSKNKFTGVVPSSFGRLSKLLLLNLELNKLQAKNKQDWRFMDSLANCSELYAFSVGYNYLTGEVPNSVGNLSSQLQYLYLGGNQLSGHFPSGIANLGNLVTISLFENNFTSVLPEWLGTLNSLQVLELTNNFFTGIIPSSFSNLSQLISLALEGNQLNGHIPPSLGNLQVLQELLISSNNLHGTIPKEIFAIPTIVRISLSFNNLHAPLHADIGKAKQLTYLEISSNNLSGEIPNTLGNCESLEIIELGHNFFSGTIPALLGNISNLQILNLSHNILTGSIPVALSDLQFLEQLDLSFNHLKGEVPTKGIFKNVTSLWIDGNQGLCGGPLGLHLLACPTTMQSKSAKHKLSAIQKIFIPVAIVLVCAAVFSILLLRRRKQKEKAISLPSVGGFPRISYSDLVRATEGFASSNLIGQGRYGSVYQGKLSQDGELVAIKVFSLETRGAQKSFIAECSTLRNVRHRNLVCILTACSSIYPNGNDFKALVYEFMPRGDLHNLLYSTRDSEGSPYFIPLAQRLSIMVDVSEALAYLHHNHHGTIVHCDLKPSNILLDDNMVAHVGDFGLARFKIDTSASPSFVDSSCTSSAAIKGTIGYIAPECAGDGQASTAADVYSFGVILLEIFIRRSPTDDMFKDGMDIAKLAEINLFDNVWQIVDPQLLQEMGHNGDIPVTIRHSGAQILQSLLSIALCCTKASPNERISMQEVAAKLHGIQDAYIRGNWRSNPSASDLNEETA